MGLHRDTHVVPASAVKEGMWLVHHDPQMNQRVVEIGGTRDGRIKLHVDHGNGGEPGTVFFDPRDKVLVSRVRFD